MIVLDILFRICFGPLQKAQNGRFAAILIMTQIMGTFFLGIAHALLFFIGIESSIGGAILGSAIALCILYILNKIYVKNEREVGVFNYPFLMGILIFVLVMASAFFMLFCMVRFRTWP